MLRFRLIRTYFLEIWLFFVATIVSTMALLSLVLYGNFETATADTINSLNQQFLAETHRINEYLQKMIKISGMELFFEPAIQQMMYQEQLSNFEMITGIRRLNSVQSMGLYTHSIYVYNASQRYVYSTSNRDSNPIDAFYDTGLGELLSPRSDIRRLAPIPRVIQDPSGPTPVYSFVFYESFPGEEGIHGALIINITIDWLREVLTGGQGLPFTVMFVNPSGQVAYHSDHSLFLHDVSHEPFFSRILNDQQTTGYFVQSSRTGRYLVFYSTSEDSTLYLIRLYSYDTLLGGIAAMRKKTWIVVFVFVAAGTAVAFAISRRLYRPIQQLVHTVGSRSTRKSQRESDLDYLCSSFQQLASRNRTLEEITASYRATLQKEALREILLVNAGMGKDIKAQFHEYGLPFDTNQHFRVMALKGVREADLSALPLAAETLRMTVPLSHSAVVILFQNLSPREERKLARTLRQKGARVIVCSGIVDQIHQLPRQVLRMQELTRFSFLYKKGSVLGSKDLNRMQPHSRYPTDLEQLLLHHLRQGLTKDALEIYEDFVKTVSVATYDHFRFSVKRLFISIQLLVREMQLRGMFAAYAEQDIDEFERFLDEMDSIAQLNERLSELFSSFEVEVLGSRLRRSSRITDEILAMIQREYTNPNMSLKYVSDAVGLSPSYASRLFKDVTEVSVSESILACRIDKAKQMLLDEPAPAREIAHRVGFLNENYFYTVFHKKTGKTPSRYRKQANMHGVESRTVNQ